MMETKLDSGIVNGQCSMKEAQTGTNKYELNSSVLICFYPWFIENILDKCTNYEISF
ncbi:hypothetical protein [Methanosarcina barkeri]|uniref:hypothetical protein n=1 Tax=Methanosarcina barkeri TaxID=2208 RepID=UPI000AA7CF81|nr:hypothetical protein [Methanosarcina barkeri]